MFALPLLAALALTAEADAPTALPAAGAEYERSLLSELSRTAPNAVEEARAAAEAYQAGRWAEAFERYGRVLEAAPRFSHALRRRCTARLALGEPAEAAKLCRAALELAPLPENQVALARTLASVRPVSPMEASTARQLARAALAARPADPAIASSACDAAVQLEDLDLLGQCAGRLGDLAPDEIPTQEYQALAAVVRGEYRAARAHLARARKLGLPPDQASELARVIDSNEPFSSRWGPPAAAVLATWAVGLVLLLALGAALSSATLRSAAGIARTPPGGEASSLLLRRLYRAVLWLSCAYYYFSIPLVLLAVLGLAAGFGYLVLAAGRIPIKLVLIVGFVVLVTIWAVLKSLWASLVRRRDADPGLLLDRAAHPRFDAAERSVAARIGTRPVDRVFLTPGTDVAVFERSGLFQQLAGRAERCLILGVGVLAGLTQGELKAVLAHEHGHLVNRDTAGGGFALAVRRSLFEMAKTLAEGGAATAYNPAWWFVRGFHRVFLRISQGASRLQEILADRWAALAYGGDTFGRGLRGVIERGIRFDAQAQRTLREVIEGSRPLANLYAYSPQAPASEEELASELEKALGAEPSAYDSHPRPADRIAWTRGIAAAEPAAPEDALPAWELFTDREALERRMTDQIRAAVAANHQVAIPSEAAADAPAPTPAP